MSQSTIPQRLKRAKARIPISLQGRSGGASKTTNDIYSSTLEPAPPRTVNRMLRILLRDPWDDYDYIWYLDQDMLASRKAAYFELVNIQQCHSFNVLQHSRILPTIHHPNVATIYDVYCHDNKTFLITEHLDISISQLEIQNCELEEWEIATIIAEVPTICYMEVPWLIVAGSEENSLCLLTEAVLQRSLESKYPIIY